MVRISFTVQHGDSLRTFVVEHDDFADAVAQARAKLDELAPAPHGARSCPVDGETCAEPFCRDACGFRP